MKAHFKKSLGGEMIIMRRSETMTSSSSKGRDVDILVHDLIMLK